MGIERDKVNLIWDALEIGKDYIISLGPARMKTSQMVDLIVQKAMERINVPDASVTVTREEVLEAWLYQSLEQFALARGVHPLPSN
jgi:hypothetical protein